MVRSSYHADQQAHGRHPQVGSLRVAAHPLAGATPAARRSRIRGVPRTGLASPADLSFFQAQKISQFGTAIQRDFGVIADLVRLHAQQAPERPALADATRALNYGALDALMDRVAAACSATACGRRRDRDLRGIERDYAAVFLGALRAGVAVAPLAPGSTPASLAG